MNSWIALRISSFWRAIECENESENDQLLGSTN